MAHNRRAQHRDGGQPCRARLRARLHVDLCHDFSPRNPRTWTFETGNDGFAWTSRGGPSDPYFVGPYEPRALLVASPAANARFRLNITAKNGSSVTQLAEFRAWEHVAGPASFKVFSLADSGSDRLRAALTTAGANAGQALLTFASNLAGGTITSQSRLAINDADGVVIDASNRPGGIVLSGGGVRRTLNNPGPGRVILCGLGSPPPPINPPPVLPPVPS
jgi:hypothetical protein